MPRVPSTLGLPVALAPQILRPGGIAQETGNRLTITEPTKEPQVPSALGLPRHTCTTDPALGGTQETGNPRSHLTHGKNEGNNLARLDVALARRACL